MTADLILQALLRANLAASGAIVAVLLLRALVRRLLGAEIAYGLWLLVPVAALTSLFPNLRDFRSAPTLEATKAALSGAGGWMALFLAGACAVTALFAVSEWRFRRLARAGRVGPAVVGAGWPSLVVPSDYAQRFTAAERELIRLHERTHIERQHIRDNRWIATMQVLGWFNPLIHLAARCARLDQELACDAAVIEARPKARRLYAETLLKGAKVSGPWSAFACALTEGGRHPLEVRVAQLARPRLTLRQFMLGAAAVGALSVMAALSVWSLSPVSYVAGQAYRDLPFGAAKITTLRLSPDG